MPIIIFSCVRSLYLVQCSHLEHFYRFFKSGIPEKPYITSVFLVVPIISLTPIIAIFTLFFPFFLFYFSSLTSDSSSFMPQPFSISIPINNIIYAPFSVADLLIGTVVEWFIFFCSDLTTPPKFQ